MTEKIIGKSRPNRWRDLGLALAGFYVAGMLIIATIENSFEAILIMPLVIWILPAFMALGLSNKTSFVGRYAGPVTAFAIVSFFMLNGSN